MVVLKLLGGASLEAVQGAHSGPAVQRHRIALLAVLATARARAVGREKLMALLWPERDTEQVRRLLNQSVYVLRRALGDEAIVSAGDALRLNTNVVCCDAIEFEEAVAAGRLERAAEIYTGPFLDGFFLSAAPELERWMEEERTRLAELQAKVLHGLAEAAEARGDLRVAIAWLKALVAHGPCDSRAVLQLMRALESAGDPAGALLQATAHQRVLQEELGVGLPPEITAVVARLRACPASDGEPPLPGRASMRPAEHVAAAIEAPVPREARLPATGATTRRLRNLTAYGAVAFLIVAAILVFGRPWLFNPPAPPLPEDSRRGDLEPLARAETGDPARRTRGEAQVLPPEQRTASIAAYELYQKGNDPAMLRDDAAARQAQEYFRQAVSLDPSYAAAWLGLARLSLRSGMADMGDIPREDALRLALDASRRAVALDDSLALGHAFLGLLRMFEFDFPAAEEAFGRAVTLDPSNSLARQWRVALYLWTARPAEALAEAERAAALDPVSPAAQAEVARALGANGRCREALARLERLEAVEPPLLRVAIIAAECKAQLQMWEDAIEELRSAPGGSSPLRQALLGHLLARAGEREEALQVLAALLDRRRNGRGGAFPIAVIHAGLGDAEQALEWLELAIEDRSLLAMIHHFTVLHPVLDMLAGDPRLDRLSQLSPLARARRRPARTD